MQLQYEVARWSVRHIVNISGRSVKKIIDDVKGIEIFSWEGEKSKKEATVMNAEQMKNTLTRLASYFNKDNKKRRKK